MHCAAHRNPPAALVLQQKCGAFMQWIRQICYTFTD